MTDDDLKPGDPGYQVMIDRRFKERAKEKGIVRASVWVPESRREELKELARQWRDEVKESG